MTYIPYPGTPLSVGSSGASVTYMQTLLNGIANVYTAINKLTVDGKFGTNTKNATLRFQKQFSLSADGVIGPNTWNKVNSVHQALSATRTHVTTPYPGYVVQQGSSGDNVRFIQSYISAVGTTTGYWPAITIDGQFGPITNNTVKLFQAYCLIKADGKVGSVTWGEMIPRFNNTL